MTDAAAHWSGPRLRVILLLGLACVALVAGLARPAAAQVDEPTVGETARLLGYLWADGSFSGGVWDATGPSGGKTLIEHLAEQHGAMWVDRSQLQFVLPAPYDWVEWKDSLPDDDARTRRAVRNPHFLAAVLEGEGSTAGLVYDQSSCCTAGFVEGRLTGLVALLQERGFTSARLDPFGDADSGEVRIASGEFAELRATHTFVCPAAGVNVRVPGGQDYARFGNIGWLGPGTDFALLVRDDCRPGLAITPVAAPVGDCIVTVDPGGRLRVTWSFARGSVVIRRNGVFVQTSSALEGSFVESRPPGSTTYEIRVLADSRRTVDVCGTASSGDVVEVPPNVGRCLGRIVTILGTGGRDILDGTTGVDVIHGFGGDDLLRGFGSDDLICGGAGNDRLRGGYGNDRILGGDGADIIVAGPGADTARGGNGADRLEGNRGPDVLIGGAGSDVLRAGAGFDSLIGGRGADVLRGGPHRDTCVGGWGVDLLAADCERATQ